MQKNGNDKKKIHLLAKIIKLLDLILSIQKFDIKKDSSKQNWWESYGQRIARFWPILPIFRNNNLHFPIKSICFFFL